MTMRTAPMTMIHEQNENPPVVRDRESFTLFFNNNFWKVFGYAKSLVQDQETARDISQEAFRSLCKTLGGKKKILNPMAYVCQSARNLAASHRRKKTEKEFSALDMLEPLSESTMTERESGEELLTALNQLSNSQREVIFLHIYNGLTFQEISQTLGEAISTVQTRYYAGLEKLKELLNTERD